MFMLMISHTKTFIESYLKSQLKKVQNTKIKIYEACKNFKREFGNLPLGFIKVSFSRRRISRVRYAAIRGT